MSAHDPFAPHDTSDEIDRAAGVGGRSSDANRGYGDDLVIQQNAEDDSAAAESAEETTGPQTEQSGDDDLESLSKDELVGRAEKAGVAKSGSKAELIERLRSQ